MKDLIETETYVSTIPPLDFNNSSCARKHIYLQMPILNEFITEVLKT